MARRMKKLGEDSFDPLNLTNLRKELELAIKKRRGYAALVHTAARGRQWLMEPLHPKNL